MGVTSQTYAAHQLENNYTFVTEVLRPYGVYSVYTIMNAEIQHAEDPLVPGQLWKTDAGYILITERGRRLVYYKKLREPNQRNAVTNLIRPEALVGYLKETRAELMPQRA